VTDRRKARRTARRQSALDQRTKELALWQGDEKSHPRVDINTSNADLRVKVEDKIRRAVEDITNLKTKLGIFRPDKEA